jgi:hypothetical protein
VSAQAFGGGAYEVIFKKDVTQCAFVATIGVSYSTDVPPAGEIGVAGRFGNPRGVFVQTRNSQGAGTDLGLHLVVICKGDDDD